MLEDVVAVRAAGGHRLEIEFEDGVQGTVDLADLLRFEGVFTPLRDPAELARVKVHPELGTVCWPGGADLAPDVLYARITVTLDELTGGSIPRDDRRRPPDAPPA